MSPISDEDLAALVRPYADPAERAAESVLRPTSLAEFEGQPRVSDQLGLVLEAARHRGGVPDHVLLSGPPGLGKTTLAMIIASEMNAPLRISSGPAIQHAGDLAAILSGLFRAPAIGGGGASRAYVTAAGDDPASGGQLVVEARDRSNRQEIPVGGAAAFSFDPTSTTLAFIAPNAATDPPAPIPSGPLKTVDAATGDVRTLLEGNVLAFFWSPDGQTIAALDLRPADSGPGPGQARASGARLASAASVATTALPAFAAGTPGVGLHLSFIDAASGAIRSERDLRVSDLFAFQVLPYFDQYALSHHFWAPDSSSIVLPVAEEDGLDRVVVIPADGSDPRTVATGWIGFWSP